MATQVLYDSDTREIFTVTWTGPEADICGHFNTCSCYVTEYDVTIITEEDGTTTQKWYYPEVQNLRQSATMLQSSLA